MSRRRVCITAILLVLTAVSVLVGRATALAQPSKLKGETRPIAISLAVPVVFTQAPCRPKTELPHAGSTSRDLADLGQGARLVLLQPDGRTRVLTAGFHSACDPDVSVNGKCILFAGKLSKGDDWNIFELDLERFVTRQITRNAGWCRSPIYTSTFYTITEREPWEQIAFVSTRADAADERDGSPATSLFTCTLDGSFLQRITYNLASDLDPAIMADGRLVYASWHRATLDDGPRGRLTLETINTDGSDRAPLIGRQTEGQVRMPCVTANNTVVFVESLGSSRDGAGALSSVSLRRPMHTYRQITTVPDGCFHSPAPLPDGRILVSWRPADGFASLGLFLLDPATGRRELVFDDPHYHDFQARAISARRRPDGRSSVVSADDPLAEFYCMNVYITDLANSSWLPKGSVNAVRVIEGVPPAPVGDDRARSPLVGVLSARRILAEVPIEKDGSFHISVPASMPIQLQLLDQDGMALRSCGWIWARNHQAQGCMGCHEDPELTPPNRVPEAIRRTAVMTAVPEARRTAVDFTADIEPIVASRCASCHRGGAIAPDLDLAGAPAGARLDLLYRALLGPDEAAGKASGLGKYTHPGRARTSPLVWHVRGRNMALPWDGAAIKRAAKAIPHGSAPPLSEAEKQTIIRWIDLGARPPARPDASKRALSGTSR
jgi:Tol biopolymer transport system component